jgi:hypothetical protein
MANDSFFFTWRKGKNGLYRIEWHAERTPKAGMEVPPDG